MLKPILNFKQRLLTPVICLFDEVADRACENITVD